MMPTLGQKFLESMQISNMHLHELFDDCNFSFLDQFCFPSYRDWRPDPTFQGPGLWPALGSTDQTPLSKALGCGQHWEALAASVVAAGLLSQCMP